MAKKNTTQTRAPALVIPLFRWRIFESANRTRFVMAAAADGTPRGPIPFLGLDARTMRLPLVGAVAYELVGPPGYDDLVQYEMETGWSVRDAHDITVDACREFGIPANLMNSKGGYGNA